jgi:hypothetical protein
MIEIPAVITGTPLGGVYIEAILRREGEAP